MVGGISCEPGVVLSGHPCCDADTPDAAALPTKQINVRGGGFFLLSLPNNPPSDVSGCQCGLGRGRATLPSIITNIHGNTPDADTLPPSSRQLASASVSFKSLLYVTAVRPAFASKRT
jgi:hypothetical protein